MSPETVLSGLKYLSFLVTASSGIWALSTKTTFEDDQGRKRLTAAGHVAVAIIIASALVGMLSYGFETLAKQDAQRVAHDREIRQQQKQERDALAHAAEIRDERAHQELAEANRQRDAANQRFLILAMASEQRGRELEIARRVSRGSAENLARAEVALTQLDRVLNPIGNPSVLTLWTIREGTPGTEALFARLAAIAAELTTDSRSEYPGISVSRDEHGRLMDLNFTAESPALPMLSQEPALREVLTHPAFQVTIYRRAVDAELARARIVLEPNWPNLGFQGRDGDLRMFVTSSTPNRFLELDYSPRVRQIEIRLSATLDRDHVRASGRILSISDLEGAVAAASFDDAGSFGADRAQMNESLHTLRRFVSLSLMQFRFGGRTFVLQYPQTLRTRSGLRATFFAPIQLNAGQ